MRNDDARAADQQLLNERLLQLERNQERLIEALSKLGRQPGSIPTKYKPIRHRHAPGRWHGDDGVTSTKGRQPFGRRTGTAVLLTHSAISDHSQWTSGGNGELDDNVL